MPSFVNGESPTATLTFGFLRLIGDDTIVDDDTPAAMTAFTFWCLLTGDFGDIVVLLSDSYGSILTFPPLNDFKDRIDGEPLKGEITAAGEFAAREAKAYEFFGDGLVEMSSRLSGRREYVAGTLFLA